MAKSPKKKTAMPLFPERDPDEARTSPWKDESMRFAVDQLLRKHGFIIHARAKDKEPFWEKYGFVLSESDALDSLDDREVADAEYKEAIYWEDKYEKED